MSTKTRITRRFAALKKEGRPGLVTFVTAGDPDRETSQAILDKLPEAGADVIELGMPFSDPMADGPAIQASSQRALKARANMKQTLDMVRTFRGHDDETPIVLMGYFNPIYIYGVEAFLDDAKAAGVDGLIIVDLPPEENEMRDGLDRTGIDLIYLTAPTTDDARLPAVVKNASGFVYYVSITGITGTRSADTKDVAASVQRLRKHTDLPIAIGFGIKTPEQAREIGACGDAAVVGSALVGQVADNLNDDGSPTPDCAEAVLGLVKALAQGVRAV